MMLDNLNLVKEMAKNATEDMVQTAQYVAIVEMNRVGLTRAIEFFQTSLDNMKSVHALSVQTYLSLDFLTNLKKGDL